MTNQEVATFEMERRSQISGRLGKMSFPLALKESIEAWLEDNRTNRPHVQNAFPGLSADHREFLITGITPEEWKEAFGDEEE